MRKKNIKAAIGLALIGLLICPVSAVPSFPDVDETSEYAEAVEYLKDIGIMRGDDKGNFNPNKTVTRAEMATIICNMLGETKNLAASEAFTDVPINHWANKYITKAKELGVISGYGNKKFGPNDNVNYEQTVTMIVRAVGYMQEAQEAGGYPDGFLLVAQNNGWLDGIMAEKGEFLSRADIASIIYAYYHSNSIFGFDE